MMKKNLCLFTLTLLGCIASNLFPANTAWGYKTTFSPTLSIGQNYHEKKFDNDVDNEYDFVTSVSANLLLNIDEKNKNFKIYYTPSYNHYSSDSEKSTFRHYAGVNGSAEIARRTTLNIQESFSYTDEEEFDTDNPLQRRNRETYYSNNASISLNKEFGPAGNFRLGYDNSILENDDEDVEDNTVHSPFMGFKYGFSPRLDMEFNATFARSEYDTRATENWDENFRLTRKFTKHWNGFIRVSHTRVKNDPEIYNIYNPSMGFDYTLGKNMFLSLGMGYRFKEFEDNTGDDDGDISLDATFTRSWSLPRTDIRVNLGTGYETIYSDTETENDGSNQYYRSGMSVDYRFTRLISGAFNTSYRINDHEVTDKELATFSMGTSLSWQLSKEVALRGNYNFQTRDSTEDGEDFDEHRVSLGLNYNANRWLSMGCSYKFKNVNGEDPEDSYIDNSISMSVTFHPSYKIPRGL